MKRTTLKADLPWAKAQVFPQPSSRLVFIAPFKSNILTSTFTLCDFKRRSQNANVWTTIKEDFVRKVRNAESLMWFKRK